MKPAYGTNVHPAETLAEVWEVLKTYAVPLKALASPERPMPIGLFLPAAAAEPLARRPESAADFRAFLREAGLEVATVNAFPFGGFHAARVKEQVYRPDWTTPRRLAYTLDAAEGLAALMEPGQASTLSTLPGSWKAFGMEEGRLDLMASNLLEAASGLSDLERRTGKRLTLCLEPEPGCTLETTAETIAFFKRRLFRGDLPEETVRRHLGVCFDACHLAVQFEDLPRSMRLLADAGVRIAKVQLSSALSARDPAHLRPFDEPRFLHQVRARLPDGTVLGIDDLDRAALAPDGWDGAAEWRCHFHVPVHRAQFPPLGTTQADLLAAIRALKRLPEAPDLEIETYTWNVLPEAERPKTPADLVKGIAAEIAFVNAALGA